jgi:hypothetical protein
VKISGQARDSDDVGELMRRLQLSLYFEDVRLDRTQEVSINGGRAGATLAVHSFVINARARY